ncbi:MAG: hypothetical protein AB1529_02095 [Candidatus Micrarchaeota archaeon]
MKTGPAALFILLLLSACAQKAPAQTAYSNHTVGPLSFDAPSWPDAAKEPGMFMARTNGTCLFGAAAYPVTPIMLEEELKKAFNASGQGGYLRYSLSAGGRSLGAATRLLYCDYKTYALTVACEGVPDERALGSASCKERQLDVLPKLGMVASPAGDDPLKLIDAMKEARGLGTDVLYWYFSYKDIADNWTLPDYLMEPLSYEGRTAITISVIHTSVLGAYPSRYSSFDEPGFADEFAGRSAGFAARYKPDYLFVGNEVDDYLYSHRDKVPAFKEILRKTRERVHEASPGTKVGFTTTYHDAISHNATDIIGELAEEADIIGYTSYGYHDLFMFDNVSRGEEYLDAPAAIVPGKPYAIVETGWSSSFLLNSSVEKQEEFAKAYFARLNDTDAEFMTWFALHDGSDCTAAAESFLTDAQYLKNDAAFMSVFKEYLCSPGIKYSDGTPKKAWSAWQK